MNHIRALAFLLALFFISTSFAQSNYTVVKVNGNVFSSLMRRNVKTGDVIKSSDKLTFDQSTSYLYVMNPEGRKTIRNVPDNSPRELATLLQKFLVTDKKYMKSRNVGEAYIEHLASKFKYDTIVIVGSGMFVLDTASIKLEKPAGLKVNYVIDGAKVEKIVSENAGFSLGKENLFGKLATSGTVISLTYLEDVSDPFFSNTKQFGTFYPAYLDGETLKNELKTIAALLKGQPYSVQLKEIAGYLRAEYGTVVEENLEPWLLAGNILTK